MVDSLSVARRVRVVEREDAVRACDADPEREVQRLA
jgi:hypothetical protein